MGIGILPKIWQDSQAIPNFTSNLKGSNEQLEQKECAFLGRMGFQGNFKTRDMDLLEL